MNKSNNAYLYNLILSSSLIEYDEQYNPILGLDGSLALYLFKYSKELFFDNNLPFTECSLISTCNAFFNTSFGILSLLPAVSNLTYDTKNIQFTYLNRFTYNIYHINHLDSYNILYTYNEPLTITYKGLFFKTLDIECIITYCIYQYSKLNKSLSYLLNIISLLAIYKNSLVANNILINLLRLNLNIKTIIKNIIKDISKMNTFNILGINFSDKIIKDRSLEILEFCHG